MLETTAYARWKASLEAIYQRIDDDLAQLEAPAEEAD